MEIFGLVVAVIFLFIFLSISADIALANVHILGYRLRITPFALGLMLGMLTTLPELFIGINAQLKDVASIAFGNIMGGIVVLFGLVTGLSVVANRVIETTHLFHSKWLLLMGGLIVLPMFLGMDGVISTLDGLFLVVVYILILNGLVGSASQEDNLRRIDELKHNRTTRRVIVLALIGVVGIMVFSHFTLLLALRLTQTLNLPLLFTGLVIFSLGTNLPELTVAFTSWRHGIKRLSLGTLLGSAFTNTLVIGALSALKPITIKTLPSFWITFAILLLLVSLYIFFGHSGHKFTRKEGLVLLGIYLLFLTSELIWLLA